ncbi:MULTISPECIES: phosphate/phosphite/phosphonate ABC transporter substrate-binding protein [Marinobacter]|uniref:Phosphate ABC transporter substrate-binding protein n=1 Tax=Marinobacter profundi TaxID=2666256 RepID=A0A2G1UL58_9GAMM|nr:MULTISPECIES: phosphate/phosphite/phosphonate ABC transporter substrate-binding protein [Marinobacter]MBD3657786.1 phosphate/phosphite/phosphonate ABC transporter substrate-binding protein [Marinobacter sp.]PHQ15159.1 phosphate ABC transporter substrate-binding protein [Marinobacter profundi]
MANLLIRSVLMLLALLAAPLQAATLTFGVVPQESAGRLAEQWTPLMRLLSAELGVPVRFATAPDIPTFERRVLEGQYDIVYMNPYHYVEFSSSPGYRAIAREGDKRIHGIVVVAESNPATGLEALEGQTVAFPAPAAFAATLLVRAELERLGVRYTPQFVGSHESVYLNVAKGFAVAGGGIERTYHRALKTGLEGVRVLWRSKGYTPHAFAVHPDVEPEWGRRLQQLLVALGQNEDGRALLERLNVSPIVPAADSDWDDVRGLGLDLITTPGEDAL